MPVVSRQFPGTLSSCCALHQSSHQKQIVIMLLHFDFLKQIQAAARSISPSTKQDQSNLAYFRRVNFAKQIQTAARCITPSTNWDHINSS